MELSDVLEYRLANQQITNSCCKSPAEVVAFMGAVQAQNYPASLWGIGLRLKDSTKEDVERAIEGKLIVRTWSMRQTLHFVSSNDVRWMLGLYREQIIPKYQKKNGLTEKILEQAERIIVSAFDKKSKLTSKELYAGMEGSGIPALKKREVQAHILRRAGREGIVCYASHDGKRATFALLDRWITKKKEIPKEEALSKLALRYFTSHGPATIRDYVWWSGLSLSKAKIGMERAALKLATEEIDGKTYYMPKRMPKIGKSLPRVHLLPDFDEYIISYKDRSAMLAHEDTQKMLRSGKILLAHSNGVFLPTIVVDGQVVGTWKRISDNDKVTVATQPFLKLGKDHIKGIKEAAERYSNFLGKPVILK